MEIGTALQLTNLSHYPLHHMNIQAYMWYFQEVTHLGTALGLTLLNFGFHTGTSGSTGSGCKPFIHMRELLNHNVFIYCSIFGAFH